MKKIWTSVSGLGLKLIKVSRHELDYFYKVPSNHYQNNNYLLSSTYGHIYNERLAAFSRSECAKSTLQFV